MASYPTAIKTWVARTDGVDYYMATDVNTGYDEITAVETNLGLNIKGSSTDLATRLLKSINAAGLQNFAASTALTIANGAITVTQNWHTLDTEGAAATDNLDTITAGADGQILYFRITDNARAIVIRHAVGNIYCPGASPITLSTTGNVMTGIYDSVLAKWLVSAVSAAALLGGNNVFAGTATFNGSVATKYILVSANTILDATHHTVGVNTTGASYTITLPAAAGCAGREYIIKKMSADANTVTIDGNAAETIDGAATKVISSQWGVYHIQSDGTNWMII